MSPKSEHVEPAQPPQPETPLSFAGPITAGDRPAFEAFGLKWPERSRQEEWIDTFQDYIDNGSYYAAHIRINRVIGLGPDDIHAARQTVLEAFPLIPSDANPDLLLTASDTLIENIRMLFWNRHRIDPVKLVQNNSHVLRSAPLLTQGRLNNFERHGLSLQKFAQVAISMHPATFDQRLHNIAKIKFPNGQALDPVRAANAAPTLVTKELSELQNRADNLADLGLDAAHVADSFAEVLLYLPASLRTKFFVLESAFRYWGAADARSRAVATVNALPEIVGRAPRRVRILARLCSALLPSAAIEHMPPTAADSISINALKGLLMQKSERLIATYLHYRSLPSNERPEFSTLADFRNYIKLTVGALGEAGIAAIIGANPDDEVVTYYTKTPKHSPKRKRTHKKKDSSS